MAQWRAVEKRSRSCDRLGKHNVKAPGHVSEVLLVFERDADRALECVGPTGAAAMKQGRGLRPVDRLGDARRLAQRLAPSAADRGDDGARRLFSDARGAQHDDAGLALRIRVIDPVIDASTTE